MVPGWLKMAAGGPQISCINQPTKPQDGFGKPQDDPQMAAEADTMAQNGPKRPHAGLGRPQDDPKMAAETATMAQDGSRMAPEAAPEAPKWPWKA